MTPTLHPCEEAYATGCATRACAAAIARHDAAEGLIDPRDTRLASYRDQTGAQRWAVVITV